MADVQVGLGAVLGDEHLAVLERVHGAGVDVEIGVQLLHGDAQPAGDQQAAEAGGGEALAERGGDPAGHEQMLGEFCAGAHGPPAYRRYRRRSCRHPPESDPEASRRSTSRRTRRAGRRPRRPRRASRRLGPGPLPASGRARPGRRGQSEQRRTRRRRHRPAAPARRRRRPARASRRPGWRPAAAPASSASWATSARASQVEVSRARSAASSRIRRRPAWPSRRTGSRSVAIRRLQPRPLRPLPHHEEHQPGVRRYAGRDVEQQVRGSSAGRAGPRSAPATSRGPRPSRARSAARGSVAAGSAGAATGASRALARPESGRLGHQVAAGAERQLGPAGHHPLQQPRGPGGPAGTQHGVVPGHHQRAPGQPGHRERQRAGLVAVSVHHVGTAQRGQGRAAAGRRAAGSKPWAAAVTAGQNTRTACPRGRQPGTDAGHMPPDAPVLAVSTSAIFIPIPRPLGGAVRRSRQSWATRPGAASRSAPAYTAVAATASADRRQRRPPTSPASASPWPAAAPAPPASTAAAAPPSIGRVSPSRLGRPGRAGPATSRPRRR